jgi:hypothetical protein
MAGLTCGTGVFLRTPYYVIINVWLLLQGTNGKVGSINTRMTFPQFICALGALGGKEGGMKNNVFSAVLALNVEGHICVHSDD